jgi:hypothetical protein
MGTLRGILAVANDVLVDNRAPFLLRGVGGRLVVYFIPRIGQRIVLIDVVHGIMRWRRINLVDIVPVVLLFMVALVFGFRFYSPSEERCDIEFNGLEGSDRIFGLDWEEGSEDGAATCLLNQ